MITRPIINVAKMFDEPPPANPVSEAALLGAAMLDGSIVPDVVSAGISPEVFTENRHAAIWAAIAESARGSDLNLVVLEAALRRSGILAEIGGLNYLESLCLNTPGPATWPTYAKAVLDCHTRRKIIEACGKVLHAAYVPSGRTAEEIGQYATLEVEKASRAAVAKKDVTLADAINQVLRSISDGKPATTPTGVKAIDDIIDGFPVQGLVTIMGIPGSGKTTLALNIAVNMCKRGLVGRMFSYEQPPKRIAATMMASELGKNVHKMLNKPVNEFGQPAEDLAQVDATHALANLDFAMVEDNMHAGDIYHRCASYSKAGVKFVIVDYLQHLPPVYTEAGEEGRISDSMNWLARIARDFQMTVIVISQMTLAATRENRAPKATDGRGAQEINAASDLMLGVHRPFQNEEPPSEDDQALDRKSFAYIEHMRQRMDEYKDKQTECDVWILKNKYGPMGVAPMRFHGETMRFGPR